MTQSPAKKSFFNRNVDLMNGPIFKSLFVFMLPILVSCLFQQLYNTVDTMIVGNVLGDTALAAIGACGAIYELLVGFGIGIGNGLAIVAARAYGAGDEDQLKQTVAGSIVIGIIASAVITLAGAAGLHPLLELLDTPAEILEDAYGYIIIIDLGVIVMFAYNLCAGLLRAIGNSFMPLVFLVLSSVLNVILDLWFIAVLGMGVAGAGVATVISQGVSVALCILYVFRSARLLLPGKKHFHVGSRLYWELFSQSISMGLMSSIVSAGSVVLQYGINGLGTLVIAGHTAARKLFAFTDMPLTAMASACSTYVSQNYGANHPDRVRRGMRDIYLYSVVAAVAAVLLMAAGAEWMVKLVSGSSEPVVLENGILYVFRSARLLLPGKKHFHVGSRLYWELFSQSISMGLMSSIVSAGSVVLQYGINGLGTLVIAGHTAARKLFAFTDMPLTAMASACSTYVSQNYGANHPDRVRRGMRDIYLYSVVAAVAAVLLMAAGAEWMVKLVSGSSEPVVLENGARYLVWNAPFYAVLGMLLSTRYALQSMGEKVLPLLSSVIEFLGKIVFVLLFIPRFGYNAVILCEPVIWCFMTIELLIAYRHDPFVFPKKK